MAVGRNEAEAIIRIVGEDQVRQIIQGATDDLKATERQAKKVEDASRGIGGAWDDLGKQVGDLADKLGVLAAMEIGQQIAAGFIEAAEAVREGARALAADGAFAKAFGASGDVLERFRASLRGMVADADLQALALQAQRAGLNVEQTASVFDAASRAAIGTGQSAREVAGQLVELAIGTASEAEEGLKRLGVVVDADRAQKDYAASLGLTTDQLSRQQQQLVALGFVTDDVSRAFDGVTGKEATARVERAAALWANLTTAMKEAAAEAVVAPAEMVDELTAGLTELTAVVGKATGAQAQQTTALAGWMERAAEAARAARDLAAEEAAIDAAFEERGLWLRQQAAAAAEKQAEAHRVAAAAARDEAAALAGLYDAVERSTSALGKQLLEQAKVARALGNEADAGALEAQAAGLAAGDTGNRPAAKAARGGGRSAGRTTEDPDAEFKRRLDALAETTAQWQADLDAETERARAESVQRQIDATYQQVRDVADAQAQAERDALAARQAGLDGLRDSILGVRDAFGDLGTIDLGGLATLTEQLGALTDQFAQVGDAASQGAGAMAASTLGAVAASGKMVAGIIKDQRAQAVIMALVEQAEAWASFARYDYVGFGAHMISSGLWAAVAGKGGGGGGRGAGGGGGGARGRADAPRIGAGSQAPQQAPAQPITVHISGGTYLGTSETTVGRDLGKMVAAESAKGVRESGRAFAPR